MVFGPAGLLHRFFGNCPFDGKPDLLLQNPFNFTLMKKSIWMGMLLALGAAVATGQKPQNYFLLAGTYTTRGAEGIYVYSFDARTGKSQPVSVVKGLRNPSFLVVAPDQQHVYAVAENEPEGSVYALSFNPTTGQLNLLNEQPSGGAHPCYIDIDASGQWLSVANYTGGSVSLFPILKDGRVGPATDKKQHAGNSINPERQTSPHPHAAMVVASMNEVWVPDLGLDKIFRYKVSNSGKLITPEVFTQPGGSGPRHAAVAANGKFAYVLNELNATVTAFTLSPKMTSLQTLPTLPAEFKDKNWCADIHLSGDGKFLYATNRGHQSIVTWQVDDASGRLTFVDRVSVGGAWPRNFLVDPTDQFVLVANQESDNIVVFRRNAQTGKLTSTGEEIKVSMPVCLRMIPKR